ncbi:uncharacterized protein LOC132189087 isoform X2 [Corylus avellana]|uniref:uncharacterized protein LOC132189087 isoform X2 n=1 Tax=Corylus avellana TaxID=13451 RepID=UPI00286AA5DA|nr:uncharacterized protein LOC132189087 isoform X2 [Corylus avellana]
MDFHSLARRELQALCKNNKIPANMTNVAMADALKALQHVEGLEEFLNPSDSDLSKPVEEALNGSPDIPRTACRTSTRRKPIKDEPKSTQPLSRTRRGTRGRTAEDIDQENKDVNVPITPAAPSGSRRASVAASSRRNIETQMKEDEEDKKKEAQGRSAVPSSRGRPPVASARRKLETQKEVNSVQRVYSTRRSVRLLENNMAKLSMMENGSAEPIKIDRDLFEEMGNSSETSEVSVEVEKNIQGTSTQTMSEEEGSEKTDDSEVLSNPKTIGSLEIERELKFGVKEDKSDDGYEINVLKSEQALGSEISDNFGVFKVPEAVDEAIDVGDETVEKVTVQDTGVEDSLAIKASTDVFAEVKDHDVVASQFMLPEHGIDCDSVEESLEPNLQSQSSSDVQDQASKDSHMNVVVDDDLGSHDSESEYSTDWESDEDDESDASSPESQENKSDDDAETDEKDPEAPVLPEDQMAGFEKLESKIEESDQLVNKSNTTIGNDSGSESFIAEHSEIESVDSADEESLNDDHVMVEGVCVMPAHESLDKTPTSVKKMSHLISGSEVTCKTPCQPFAADQISGQFPRPTQLTQKKSSAIEESIQKIIDVSDDDDEDLDNGNGKLELEKDKAKQDENTVDGDSILEMYTGVSSIDGDNMLAMFAGMSLRQLRKKVKMELQITHDRKNNKDKSTTKEHDGKKRVALKPLPENCMDGGI